MVFKMLPPSWREIQRRNITQIEELINFLELSEEQASKILDRSHFRLNIPLRLVQKIEKKTLFDPLLKQFLPQVEEEKEVIGFHSDPVGETVSKCAPRMLHKYHGRVLLVTTNSCVMHCRYCFRRHFDYATSDRNFEKEVELIRNDSSIKEVILSGGDPLSLSNRILGELLQQLESISHLTKLRIHTRFPIGIPERVDKELVEILTKSRLKVYFVIHTNHPKELDDHLFSYLHRLQKKGVVLLNQSVLLKGVNDDLDTLRELFETLVDQGVIPYYLHQLDRVEGGAHFEVTKERGHKLIDELRKLLPGYAVPRYVQEIAGAPYKVILC